MPKSKSKFRVTKAGLKAFLKAHPRMKFKTRTSATCPIGRFVAANNAPFPQEGPIWIDDFIHAVDVWWPTITSQEALELL